MLFTHPMWTEWVNLSEEVFLRYKGVLKCGYSQILIGLFVSYLEGINSLTLILSLLGAHMVMIKLKNRINLILSDCIGEVYKANWISLN